MRTAVRAYLVLAITLLTMLLLATKTTGQSEPQNLTHAANQAATAEPTSDVGNTVDSTDPASYFPALADQIASGAHTAVKSNDGNLTLLIPDGALPANVSAAQIKITSIRPDTVPVTVEGSRSLLAYKMEPDGLKFSTPAVAVLTMNPAADETLPLLFSVSGDEVEPITSALYTTDPKNRKLIVTVPINHFSDLLSSQGLFSVLLPRHSLIGRVTRPQKAGHSKGCGQHQAMSNPALSPTHRRLLHSLRNQRLKKDGLALNRTSLAKR